MVNPKENIKLLPNNLQIDSSVRSRFKHIAQFNKKLNPQEQHYDNDEYLADLLDVLRIRSTVVGVGGSGNNTVSRLQEMELMGTETLNINTDAHDLYYSNSSKKLLIGKETCNGLGSGNNPCIGADAAEEDVKRVTQALEGDITFITCGLGGGTGTGAAPIIAREAKKKGSIVVSFCTIPFTSEGVERTERAMMGLHNLAQFSDTIIPLPNNNLLKIAPNIPILTGFKLMDEILIRSIREVVTLINNCGLINIDFADVKRVLEKNGKYPSGLIGITESLGKKDDLIDKSKLAIHNPLLELDANKVDKCLISVTGSHELTLSKMDKIISSISNELPSKTQIKVGAAMDPEFGLKIRIMALGRGPISPYVQAALDNDDFAFHRLMKK
ncbi:MAG: Cell division protein FtsZ 1 [Promethearchaeota archaeon]|nr:MAG: Cell division protein FtsZ 1 [Candidatus Lokiarchaeota archaeon]